MDDFRQLTFDEIEMTEREEISNNLEILISDVVKQTGYRISCTGMAGSN